MKTVERITNEIKYARDMYDATIARLNEELMKAREAEEAAKNEMWVPKAGEWYWYVMGNGEFMKTDNAAPSDKQCIARHNCFRTREEAEADEERRTVTNLLRDAATKAGRKNGEFVNKEYNWILLYSRMNRVLDCGFFNTCEFPNTVYFPSRESLLTAISEIGEDRIKRVLFGVTE